VGQEQIVTVGIIIVLVIAGIFIIASERRSRMRRVRRRMRERYGEMPELKERNYEHIMVHWNEIREQIPDDEQVDDITWNDLEMDKVFERISNGNSFIGEQILYSRLHQLPRDRELLAAFEQKVAWMDSHEDERVDIEFALWKMGKHEVNYYAPMFFNNINDQKIDNIWLYRILQGSLFLLIILAVILRGPFIAAALVNFLINIMLYAAMKARYELQLVSVAVIAGVIKFSSRLRKNGSCPAALMSEPVKQGLKALEPIAGKAVLLQQKKQSVNSGDAFGILQDYLIGATLWDFIQYDKIIRGLSKYEQEFHAVYTFAGEIDMAITVGSFRRSTPGFCIPEFAAGKQLVMEAVYHPLVKDPVKNSLHMGRNLILTGSNASGKSTFIKAAAVNTILAGSIHTCLADRMVIPDARVITSMSMRDDVVGGESYFITEIKYLKRIVEASSGGRMVICMIDEILRGTNTRERIAASEAVLKYLNQKNCLVMVATHDLELTKKFEEQCDLYHFSEKLGEQDISFDYRIKDGVSRTSNAIDLLEFVDFPAAVVAEARQLSARE